MGNKLSPKDHLSFQNRKENGASICRTIFFNSCSFLIPCPLIPKGGTKSLIRAHFLKESSKNIGAGFENLRKPK